MNYGDPAGYITWRVFEGQEKLGGMKTRVNGIPQIQAPCPWSRFGRSSEKEKWRQNVLHVDIIQHFNSELKSRFEPDARQPKVCFLHPWAVFCRAVWCPNFRGKRSIKTISNRNLGLMTYWERWRSHFLLTCVECPLLELPIERRNEETMLSQN